LRLRVIEEVVDTVAKGVDPELLDHLMDAAFTSIYRRELRFQIAPVLLRHADVGEQDIEHILIDLAAPHDLRRWNADAFLMHFGQSARQTGGDSATDIGIMDMPNGEADDLAFVEDRLPDMHVGRMGADKPAIGIVGDANITFFVVIDGPDHTAVVHADEPRRAQFRRRREGESLGSGQAGGEILGLLDEGRMRRSVQRISHAFGGGDAMVLQNFERDLVDCHGQASKFRMRLPSASTSVRKPSRIQLVVSSCATIAGPLKDWPARKSARLGRCVGCFQRRYLGLWRDAGDDEPQIDDLKRGRFVRIFIEPGVFAMKGGDESINITVLYPGPLKRCVDFIGLSAVAHIGGDIKDRLTVEALLVPQPVKGAFLQFNKRFP